MVFGLLSCEVWVARVCCKPLWTLSKYIVVTLGRIRRDRENSTVAVIVCDSGIVCPSWYVCGVVGLHFHFQAASRQFAHGNYWLGSNRGFFGWLKASASICVDDIVFRRNMLMECMKDESMPLAHMQRISLGLSFWSFRGLCRKPRESSHVKLVVVGAAVRFVGLL